jgi:hypothetical protein
MEWLSSNGEVYHRTCVYWTASIDTGKCEQCGDAIPERITQLARTQRTDRERQVRDRNVRRSLRSISQRFAQLEARTDATLRRTSAGQKPDEKG